jgi:hypothetical protein
VKDVRGSNGEVLQANHVIPFLGACGSLLDAVVFLIVSFLKTKLILFKIKLQFNIKFNISISIYTYGIHFARENML